MSVLRFLSPSRHRSSSPSPSPTPSSSRSKSRLRTREPRLEFRVPSYGSVFMTPHPHEFEASLPDDQPADGSGSQPRADRESRGELDVEIPQGMGKVKVKSIKVGIRTEVNLLMGERFWEKDVIFERVVEIKECEDGVVLEEGILRFSYTILIPANLCGHDRHNNGTIEHKLFAILEGLPDPKGKSKQDSTSSPIHTPPSHVLRAPAYVESEPPSGTHTPAASTSTAVNPVSLASALSNMDIGQSHPPIPPLSAAPPYQDQGEKEDIPWLRGEVRKERQMEILWNCHPEGGVTELDVLVRDSVSGLGPFELKLTSDCWTVGGYMIGTLHLPAPSPAVTVFSFRVSLVQTHTIQSPRQDPDKVKPVSTTQSWPIFTIGNRPIHEKRPGMMFSGVWRGKEARGYSEGEAMLEGSGRCMRDQKARPSSLPHVPSPITVSHKIATEVLFSVWGEDEQGKKYDSPGPGAVRALRVNQPTTLASCAFTPEELRLPTYGSLVHQDAFTKLARKCPLCGKEPHDKLCPTCPATSIPHARHDHPPKLVGNEAGICPLCAEEAVPRREANWSDCACGMDTEYLDARLRKGMSGGSAGGNGGEEVLVRKVDSERGRRR